MKVQTDRYNWSVLVPADSGYAIALIAAACLLLIVAGYYSGVRREAITANPVRLFSAVVAAAGRRGEGAFWLVWCLIAIAAVLLFTGLVMFTALLA